MEVLTVITNRQSGTNVHEIADGIYRINTPIVIDGAGAFSFNQYLIADDEPLIFHTGPRRFFSLVREAVGSVMPVESLRYIAFSHVEADECGSLNEWLAAAPRPSRCAERLPPRCPSATWRSRAPRTADDELLLLGTHSVRWLDAPHVPHGWDAAS